MWDYAGPDDEPRFLVLAAGSVEVPADRLIVHGLLTDPDSGAPAGVVMGVQAPARRALDDWLAGVSAEVYDWEFGGRR